MNERLRLEGSKAGDSLRLKPMGEMGTYLSLRAAESLERANDLQRQYPGDRCTWNDPAGRGMPSIDKDNAEWARQMNRRYNQILAEPLAAAAMMSLGKFWDKLIEQIIFAKFLKEFLEYLEKLMKEEQDSNKTPKESPKTKEEESTGDGRLEGNRIKDGGFTYAGADNAGKGNASSVA